MNTRVIAVCIALLSLFFFYQPWLHLGGLFSRWGGAYQTGVHFGGVANGLLWLPVGFAVAYWVKQFPLARIAAGAATLLSVLFVLRVGVQNVAWGLWGVFICSGVALVMSFLPATRARCEDSRQVLR